MAPKQCGTCLHPASHRLRWLKNSTGILGSQDCTEPVPWGPHSWCVADRSSDGPLKRQDCHKGTKGQEEMMRPWKATLQGRSNAHAVWVPRRWAGRCTNGSLSTSKSTDWTSPCRLVPLPGTCQALSTDRPSPWAPPSLSTSLPRILLSMPCFQTLISSS